MTGTQTRQNCYCFVPEINSSWLFAPRMDMPTCVPILFSPLFSDVEPPVRVFSSYHPFQLCMYTLSITKPPPRSCWSTYQACRLRFTSLGLRQLGYFQISPLPCPPTCRTGKTSRSTSPSTSAPPSPRSAFLANQPARAVQWWGKRRERTIKDRRRTVG